MPQRGAPISPRAAVPSSAPPEESLVPDHHADDPHASNLVLSPEDTLTMVRPHLPCPCADCAAVTLMMAAALAIGQRYQPGDIGRVWQQVADTGEKVAELTAGLKSRIATSTPQEADISASRPAEVPRCRAYQTRGAH